MQEAVLEKYSPTAYQLMLGTNIFAILFALIGLILTETLQPALLVIFQFPKIALDILFFCVLSALGQIFIFITISHFGALTLSIITTTRKFFTILASSIFYGHTINQFQWIGVFAVFFGLSIEIFTKYEKHIQKKRKNSADQLANLNLQKT
jgi:drug/metabolite transporter (DMT)-like permease